MCNSFVLILMLQISGVLCRSSGNLSIDRNLRIQKTMEIVWPHVDWSVEPCTNFGHFSCKDDRNSSKNVECVGDARNFKDSSFANKHRQKRQFLGTSLDKVDQLLNEKLLEINNNPSMHVEPGVRKMAEIFLNLAKRLTSGSQVPDDELWLIGLARLSVCHLMEEYSRNKKFFENLIPRFHEVAAEIGARAFSDRDYLHERMQALKINFGLGNFDLPSKLTELLNGLSPTENYNEAVEKLVSYKFEYIEGLRDLKNLTENLYRNAHYIYDHHSLNFGPLFLTSPAFRTDFMYSHIFGGVLATFFHELAHSISFSFQKQEKFRTCVINEVENMSLTVECPKERVQIDARTREEIIADKLGLAMAWHMYNKYYKHLDAEKFTYKNKKISREQIFHMSFGLNLCYDDSGELGERIATGTRNGYPTIRNRKNLAVKTIPTFFDAFECENKDVDYTRCTLF